MEPRLKTEFWVQAFARRVNASGRAFAIVARKGDPDAGAILLAVNRLDGTLELFQQERDGQGRLVFAGLTKGPVPQDEAQALIARRTGFDSDLWVVEVESRDGERFVE